MVAMAVAMAFASDYTETIQLMNSMSGSSHSLTCTFASRHRHPRTAHCCHLTASLDPPPWQLATHSRIRRH